MRATILVNYFRVSLEHQLGIPHDSKYIDAMIISDAERLHDLYLAGKLLFILDSYHPTQIAYQE